MRESINRDAGVAALWEDEQLPEHFRAYREIQPEWWPYDVYCRIAMLLAHLHLMQGWSYFQLGHNFCQVRALFVALLPTVTCCVTMEVYLHMDINQKNGFPLEKIGPLGPVIAFIAMCLAYQRFFYTGGMALSFFLVYVTFFTQILYTIWLWKAARPSLHAPEAADVPGDKRGWWPRKWGIPEAFEYAVWIVAPPAKLDKGVTDLPGELRALSETKGAGGIAPAEQTHDTKKSARHHAQSNAWRLVSHGLIGITVAWVWCTLGFTVDVITQGTDAPSLLSAPGLPNNARDPRYRPPKPGFEHPVEVGTGKEAEHRRLSGDSADGRRALAGKLRTILPQLQHMVESMSAAAETVDTVQIANAVPMSVAVQWPRLFEPHLLACPSDLTAAGIAVLSPYGRGVLLPTLVHTAMAPIHEPLPFSLVGASSFGPLRASTWNEEGLILATGTGALLECPGVGPFGGKWKCTALAGARLPVTRSTTEKAPVLAVSRVRAGGIAGDARPTLRAAVAYAGEQPSVSIFQRAGDAAAWLPAGEVGLRGPPAAAALKGDSLLVLLVDGSVDEFSLTDGSIKDLAVSMGSSPGHVWKAACSPAGEGVLRLSSWHGGGAAISEPELLFNY